MCSLIYNTAVLYFAVVKLFHTLSHAKRFICCWLNKFPLFQDFGCSESGGNFSGIMSALVDRTRRWENTTSRHLLLLINKLSFKLQSGTAFFYPPVPHLSRDRQSSSISCKVPVARGHLWGGWWWCWILVMLGGGLTRILFRLLHRQLATAAARERVWWLTQWPLQRSASHLGGIPFGWAWEPLARGTEWDAQELGGIRSLFHC